MKMKNVLRNLAIVLALITVGFASACADNDKVITVKELPVKAQQFVKKHFRGDKVVLVKEDRDLIGKNYDVIFSNGNNIEFDRNGEWEDIDCKSSFVPNAIVPNKIKSYVSSNYPGMRIIKIDRDRKEYGVDLSNGIELTFDKNFKLIDIDN